MTLKVKGSAEMPFGKYKGSSLDNVPAEYLLYMYDEGHLYGYVQKYVMQNEWNLREEVNNAKKGIK